MSRLLPCPFCGQQAYVVKAKETGEYHASCPGDDRHSAFTIQATEEKAIAAWNRRAAPASSNAPSEDDARAAAIAAVNGDGPDDNTLLTDRVERAIRAAQRQLARPPLGDAGIVNAAREHVEALDAYLAAADRVASGDIEDQSINDYLDPFYDAMCENGRKVKAFLAQRPPLGSPQGDAAGDDGED